MPPRPALPISSARGGRSRPCVISGITIVPPATTVTPAPSPNASHGLIARRGDDDLGAYCHCHSSDPNNRNALLYLDALGRAPPIIVKSRARRVRGVTEVRLDRASSRTRCWRSPTCRSGAWPPRCSSSLAIEKPLLLEGEAGVGKTELAKALAAADRRTADPPAVLRGPRRLARRLRVELRAPAAAHPRGAGGRGRRAGAVRPRVPDPPAAARGDRVRRPGGAAGRRDRPRRRRVRGLPARGALRLPDHDPRDRHDHRRAAAPRSCCTSNRTRELHDALKRRCLFHWITHPSLEREIEIVRLRVPGVPERLAAADAPRSSPACAGWTSRRRPASRRRSTGRRRSSRSAARSSTRPSSSRRSAPS